MEEILLEIESLAAEIVRILNKNKQKVATVESCTGGFLSKAITGISGSSDVFDLGICTYANSAKEKYASVSHETLEKYGAVSRETAEEMARGIKNNSGADFGVSTTGIAGPNGGTEKKPVGTVYIGCAFDSKCEVIHIITDTSFLKSDVNKREYIRAESTKQALNLLKHKILEKYSDI